MTTAYNLDGYLAQLAPALTSAFILRDLFQIPGGKGRVLNVDQSMHYRIPAGGKTIELK